MRSRHFAAAALAAILLVSAGAAQTPGPTQASPQGAAPLPPPAPVGETIFDQALRTATVAEESATLSYANRPIVEFRATVLSRTPAERAEGARSALDRLVDAAPWARVASGVIGAARVITVDNRSVFAILPQDVDLIAGETTDSKAAETVARLQIAFDEAVELRNPSRLMRAGLLALAATVLLVGGLWLLGRLHRASSRWVRRSAERQLARLPGAETIVDTTWTPKVVGRAVTVGTVLLGLLLVDGWLMFVLRQFPYTRPAGEALRGSVLAGVLSLWRLVVDALPGLFVVLVIALLTRVVARLATLVFQAVEEGRITVPGVYPETAQPTRRIVIALLWVFALVVSYGYLPGSDSAAFQGVSVFIGLMISLGSTGIMNQIMSGLTLTYSRSLRVGDFVKVGDTEGTVVHLGTLATKIKTARREEITIPNAVVVTNATTNYSRLADTEGVFVPTSITIGYDTPWRQVHALLLLAAARTGDLRKDPPPVVRQTALQDFYVQYTLLVCLERADLRYAVLDRLHANILDAFNEYGVQITSPNYEADPEGAKVVPRSRWYAAPAAPEAAETAAGPAAAPSVTAPVAGS